MFVGGYRVRYIESDNPLEEFQVNHLILTFNLWHITVSRKQHLTLNNHENHQNPEFALPPKVNIKMSSRHHGSSRHHHSSRSHHSSSSSRTADTNSEDVVAQIKNIITILYDVAISRPHEWETYLPSARSAMTALDHIRFFRDPARFAEQVWIIQGLQDYAYYDADNGCISDVAEYCQASWLRVLRNYPDNVDIIAGES